MREIRRGCTRWEGVVWRWVCRLRVGGANRCRRYCAWRYRGRCSGLLYRNKKNRTFQIMHTQSSPATHCRENGRVLGG